MGKSTFADKIMHGRFTITDEFRIRPTWCDANLALEQVKNEKAKAAPWPFTCCCKNVRNRVIRDGNRLALIVRGHLQTFLFGLGSFIQKYDVACLIGLLLVFCLWAIPLRHIVLETNIEKLWVPKGGRLEAERDFMSGVNSEKMAALLGGGPLLNGSAPRVDNTPKADSSAASTELAGVQVLIQTTKDDGEDILTRDQLLLHVDVLLNLSKLSVELYNETWKMEDICFKPSIPVPKSGEGGASDLIGGALQSLVPCVMITPLDCFWEGSVPRGPFPPHDKLAGFIPISWQSLDPADALELLDTAKSLLSSVDFDTNDVKDMFARAGITHGYQTLPCIDPMNRNCPTRAPNHIDVCGVVDRFLAWNDRTHQYDNFTRIPVTTKKPSQTIGDYDSFYDMSGGGDNSTSGKEKGGGADLLGKTDTDPPECKKYADAVRDILYYNRTLAAQFLNSSTWNDYGKYLKGGCHGFAPKFMQWPEQLILGGRVPTSGDIERIGALQTIIMLATAEDVYVRFNGVNQSMKPRLKNWSLSAARDVIKQWQRKYSKVIYNWINNTDGDGKRILHPLAAASITDMVEEFSNFNWSFIFIGYGLMIAYACLSALSFARRGVRSCVGLAFCGCFVVILANISGLGCTLLFGISFNATTTQILPFLLLSLGVDEMFLLLDKYREIIKKIQHDEIGVLLRETGLSVLVTYINNIIAFFAGRMLPIPALQVFCVQVAIVLIFNLIAILTLYPAIMALDLRRQRANRVDILCCIRWKNLAPDTVAPEVAMNGDHAVSAYELEKKSPPSATGGVVKRNGVATSPSSPPPFPTPAQQPIRKKKSAYKKCTLTHFVRDKYAPVIQNVWVKIGLCMIFVAFFIASMVGIFRIPIGLELSELIPKDSAPYSFMLAREKYFSFYNMFMVMRGPNIDYGDLKTQKLMRNYLADIRNTSYTVKIELKNDWINLMSDWLRYIEDRFKTDWDTGAINSKGIEEDTGKPGIIAYKLFCNRQPGKIDCSKVNGNSTFFDADGFVADRNLFNKSITAWYNSDSMTYYVSQANFHPVPVAWDPLAKDMTVPDAPNFYFSQIPLFIDKVVDTPATMDMILQFRGVAERYSDQGLPSFPLGIPFTFWELYIYLQDSLIKAFGIITAAVFVCITIMLLNPWISALVVIVLIFMIIIELGFMGLIHIKLNPISAVTLITAVGIRVKFTVHVALSFLTTVGTRNVRIARTLEHMFIPVLHGGICTILGLIMLGFSKFEFIVMYYFLIMFALVVLGILGGLILMPVLLSWIGPPPEVIPLDKSDYLDPPIQADAHMSHRTSPHISPISLTTSIP